MNKLEILTGGVKIPELETLKKEVNEFVEQQNADIVGLDIMTYITIDGKGEKAQQVITPVAKLIYKHH